MCIVLETYTSTGLNLLRDRLKYSTKCRISASSSSSHCKSAHRDYHFKSLHSHVQLNAPCMCPFTWNNHSVVANCTLDYCNTVPRCFTVVLNTVPYFCGAPLHGESIVYALTKVLLQTIFFSSTCPFVFPLLGQLKVFLCCVFFVFLFLCFFFYFCCLLHTYSIYINKNYTRKLKTHNSSTALCDYQETCRLHFDTKQYCPNPGYS